MLLGFAPSPEQNVAETDGNPLQHCDIVNMLCRFV